VLNSSFLIISLLQFLFHAAQTGEVVVVPLVDDAAVFPERLPHGPHPGTYEGSIGKKETLELAVMIDTFKPLYLTEAALELMDRNYVLSWNTAKHQNPPTAADMMD
jgi:hypothetical protein